MAKISDLNSYGSEKGLIDRLRELYGLVGAVAGSMDMVGDTGSGSVAFNSQVLDFEGVPNQVITSVSSNVVTFGTPQNIHSGASPTFAGLTIGSGSGLVISTAGVFSTVTDNRSNWDSAYTHISADGKSHSDVVLNNTHRSSASGHSDVVLNNTHRASDGKDHSDVVLNNTHRASDGSDHSFIDQDMTVGASPTHVGLTLTGMTANSVLYANGSKIISSNTGFTYDGAGTVYASASYNTMASTGVYQIGGVDVLSVDATGQYFGTTLLHPAASTNTVFVGGTIGSAGASGASYNIGIGTNLYTTLSSGDRNVCISHDAAITSGSDNIVIGYRAGISTADNNRNIYIGTYAGLNCTGDDNIFQGYFTGGSAGAGYNNVYLGVSTGRYCTGNHNVFLGYYTGQNAGAGSNCMYMGAQAGENCTGSNNMFQGAFAGQDAGAGTRCVYIGARAGRNCTGSNNTFLGYYAGISAGVGYNNSYLGTSAGRSCTGNHNVFLGYYTGAYAGAGSNCMYIGAQAGENCTGSNNLFQGPFTGQNAGAGSSCVYLGARAGQYCTGSDNIFQGYYAGNNAGAGYDNVYFGNYTGQNCTGNYNIFQGRFAGRNAGAATYAIYLGLEAGRYATGDYNIFQGPYAGRNCTGGNNVCLGYNSSIASAAFSNCITIGDQSGYYNATSYRLIIDSIQRASAASEVTDSIIHGDINATVSSQALRLNANVLVRYDTTQSPGTKCDGHVKRTVQEVQTTDATQTTLDSITLLDENTYHAKGVVTGVKSDGSDRASYELDVTVYRTGAGGATIQGTVTSLHSQESNAAWDATFTVNGNDLRLSVTGVAATTIEWGGFIQYMNMSN